MTSTMWLILLACIIYYGSSWLWDWKEDQKAYRRYPYYRLNKIVQERYANLSNQDKLAGKGDWKDLALMIIAEMEERGEDIEEYLGYI